ncbi:MAG TPA: glyoxylate carboligase [Solirubrobacteraceae bacterium]|nr:glyoxylate carboligase [Solirubrobacteraceae bacterium]
MNPMEAVVRVMEDEGVTVAFGVPGAAILPLYDAMRHSSIRHLSVRHEEGGTHAADGWARITGQPGISIGTSGPAGTNMITGLYTCLADSIPMICITGQANRNVLHKEAFQAVDIVDIARPVCKWAYQVKETAQLPWAFREAFRVAREGRPGPVLIDLPLDVQKGEDIEYDPATDGPLAYITPEPNPKAISAALDMLAAAERPLILAGGGVILSGASEELVGFAEDLGIPVSPTYMGKGSIPEDHPLWAGIVGIQTTQRFANQTFLESDVVLAVGARFGDRHTGDINVYRGDRKFIHIDIAVEQIGRVFPADLGIVSDAKLALQALREQAAERSHDSREEWTERVAHFKATLTRRTDFDDVPIKAPRVFQELNEFFDPDTIFVTAIGLYQIWSGQFQETFKPRHYLCCGQAGPLGWEVPACIGVKLAAPEQLVVGVVGDYSFQFLMEEVAVAVQYKVPFVLVMLNNGYMGLIRQSEKPYEMNYAVGIAYEGPDGHPGIDHVAVMKAMGGDGMKVTEPGDIAGALDWAVAEAEERQVPVLVEIMIAPEDDAAMGKSIDHIREFEEVDEGAPDPLAALPEMAG